jgi:hypothetical protein
MLWEMHEPPIDVDLWGYFQEIPRCWQPHRSLLRRMFALSDADEQSMKVWHSDATRGGERSLFAIHLRRGDYRELQSSDLPWYRLVLEEWYLVWLRALWPTLHDPVLYVATDEPETTLPLFQEFAPISPTFAATDFSLPDHIRDFEILRRADCLAISNGSFSRMASILAPSTQKCFYPSFQAQRFVPYEPWMDPAFRIRFADGKLPPSRRSQAAGLRLPARIIAQSCKRWVSISWMTDGSGR